MHSSQQLLTSMRMQLFQALFLMMLICTYVLINIHITNTFILTIQFF